MFGELFIKLILNNLPLVVVFLVVLFGLMEIVSGINNK